MLPGSCAARVHARLAHRQRDAFLRRGVAPGPLGRLELPRTEPHRRAERRGRHDAGDHVHEGAAVAAVFLAVALRVVVVLLGRRLLGSGNWNVSRDKVV